MEQITGIGGVFLEARNEQKQPVSLPLRSSKDLWKEASSGPFDNLRRWRSLIWQQSCWPLLLAAALCEGCASSKPPELFGGMPGGSPAPETPLFLSGPLSLLLTNTTGFTARVTMEVQPFPGEARLVSGDLFGKSTKLLFTPDLKSLKSKLIHTAGISFLWDAAQSKGYMLSDALQGWAPVSATLQLTNLELRASPAGTPQEKIDGHVCEAATVKAVANDGSITLLQVWRPADTQGLPLQVIRAEGPPTFTFNLSKVRFEVPPDDLFLPPDSFTKYTSAEAMMNEISMRQHNLRARPSPEIPPTDLASPQQGQRPGAY